MVATFGVDYAWGRPSTTSLLAAHVKFAARYLSHDTSGKNLTASEAKRLSDAGIWLVVVWEATASRALAGRAAGAADAQAAEAEAKSCGMPSGRPIYFAVDFDATSSQQAAINAYLDGAASVLGRGRVGLYGGYGPVSRAFNAKKITWAWQTYAWSGGQWDKRAQLHQYSNDHIIGGVGLDYDEAPTSDYGQWKVGASPAPTPAPVPAPTPNPTPAAEADMPYGKLDNGTNVTTPIGLVAGTCRAIGFFADTGKVGPGKDGKPQVVKLRVAVEHAVGAYDVSEVVVDSHKGKTVVKFTNPKVASCVSVTRVGGDDTDLIPVSWDAS